jgi:hypothetical protein
VAKSWYNFFVVTGEEQPAAAPAAAAAGSRRAAEVVPELPQETAFAAPVAASGSFADIYSSAQIPVPAHGFTVLKVADMLQSEHIRALPADVKRKSILVALDAAGVPVTEIVEDAVRRDRALDTYERVLQKHLDDLRVQKQAENSALEEEINQRLAELRGRIEANNQEVAQETSSLETWRSRKQAEEERIADAVQHFVSENPVTTVGRSADTNKGGE